MKHKIFALGVTLICMLGLCACGDSIQYDTLAGSKYDEATFSKDGLTMFAQNIEDEFEGWFLSGITPENFEDKMYGQFDEEILKVFLAGYLVS